MVTPVARRSGLHQRVWRGTPRGRVGGRVEVRGRCAHGYFNEALDNVEVKELDYLITGMVLLRHQSTLALFDLGYTYSYVFA